MALIRENEMDIAPIRINGPDMELAREKWAASFCCPQPIEIAEVNMQFHKNYGIGTGTGVPLTSSVPNDAVVISPGAACAVTASPI